jgi:hypothetical protein
MQAGLSSVLLQAIAVTSEKMQQIIVREVFEPML